MMSRRSALACLLSICGLLVLLLWLDGYDYRELTFSRESGFYEEPFLLELHAPFGAKIYYTLDGSRPDENALLYTEPILIEDATSHPNVHSMRTDTAVNSMWDMMGYRLPDHPVDKCTIVRAAYLDADGKVGEAKTASYFVGYDKKTGYGNMQIMSVVTSPENLFAPDTGIYVLGNGYDEELEENANFSRHGFAWERPADIQLFDADRKSVLEQSCGIRVQGGASRSGLPKSMNFYAREEYGPASRFYVDLFGTGYLPDTITLTAGGQDAVAKFRDMFVSTLTKDKAFATMNYKPCVMFLDGEYWGVYWLTERYTDAYIEHRYGVDDDNIITIKHSRLTKEREDDWSLYVLLTNHLKDTDFTDPANYRELDYLIDVRSYLDYYATGIYIGSCVDWPGTNEAFWRARKPSEDGGFEDGRWRWMLFDVNTSSLSYDRVESDTIKWVMEHSEGFTNLCRSEEFKKDFTLTLMDLANITFSEENTEPLIDSYLELMGEPLNKNLARFYGEDGQRLYKEVTNIREFLKRRKSCIAPYVKEHFGLSGTLSTVEIETTGNEAGSVVLNSGAVPFGEDGKWSGEYFTDYPITVSVLAKDGYRFAGWEVDRGAGIEKTDETWLELEIPEDGLYIKAVFEKE